MSIHHFSLLQVYPKDKFPEEEYLDAFVILIDFAKMPFWGLVPIYICRCEYGFLKERPTEYIIKLLDFSPDG